MATRARRAVGAGLAVCVALGLGACGGGGSASTTTTTREVDVAGAMPRVDLIDEAITALETELGREQEYFEINATTRLVNLFVAMNNGTVAQPWVYFDGELTSTEGQGASGHTFRADALTFNPATLLAKVRADLPDTALEVLEILGGVDGTVQYTLGASSPQGGGLFITLGADGSILSVGSE